MAFEIEKDLELLDDYLSNRMSDSDRAAFEQKLKTQPGLKNELQFQQQLIESIQKHRMLELKSMLNNVPVASGSAGQTALLTKVASSVIVAGLITTATYWYFKDSEPASAPIAITEEVEDIDKEISQPEEPPVENPPVTTETEKEVTTKTPSTQEITATPESSQVIKPRLEVFTPESESESTASKETYDQLAFIANAFVTSSIEVNIESGNRKYSFHYIFKNGKLLLYGSFENNLYEILEFIAENKRTVFLYYKTNYYLLDEQVETPTLLVPLKDPKLIKKLTERRGY
ncbi:MAG: hypothetical protein KF687_09345 [Cyclobacteriaceae bacterium]|nr:hypothetical protein [Cyclobacteriaceae bacterium]